VLGISAAQAQNESYHSEKSARDCIHNRIAELVAQNNPRGMCTCVR
jgi:hypothetical protein